MTLFDQLGSLSTIKQLANRFYDVMDNDPAFIDLRVLHPQKLITTKKKLFRFLTHWLGGPKRLSRIPLSAALLELRHRHVELTEHHTHLWLNCMDKAMVHLDIDPALKQTLNHKFSGMIKAMQQQRITLGKAGDLSIKKGAN
jgi:hemoglobin